MKPAILALFCLITASVQSADLRAPVDDAHYPKGIYFCDDHLAGTYLLEVSTSDSVIMVNEEDMGELLLEYSTSADKLDHFDAIMRDGKKYIGKLVATPRTATLYFPDKSVVQCTNKRPLVGAIEE